MSKVKRPLRLTAELKKAVLNTLETQFKKMSIDERKAVLKHIGISKTLIESKDEDGMLKELLSSYSTEFDKFDFNNPRVNPKFKKGAEYISKKRKEELKTEIKNYKKL